MIKRQISYLYFFPIAYIYSNCQFSKFSNLKSKWFKYLSCNIIWIDGKTILYNQTNLEKYNNKFMCSKCVVQGFWSHGSFIQGSTTYNQTLTTLDITLLLSLKGLTLLFCFVSILLTRPYWLFSAIVQLQSDTG